MSVRKRFSSFREGSFKVCFKAIAYKCIIVFYIFVKDLTSHFKSSRPSSHTKWRFREGFSGEERNQKTF